MELAQKIKSLDNSREKAKRNKVNSSLSDCNILFFFLISMENTKTTPKTKEKVQKHPETDQQEREIIKSLPRKIRFRIALTGFCTAIAIGFALFILSFFTDFFSAQIVLPKKYVNQTVTLAQTTGEIALHPQYLYDGKKYPNLPEQMPVFQLIGSLTNTSSLVERITAMKLGTINLKAFPDRQLTTLEMTNPTNPDERFSLNFKNGNLSLHAIQLVGEKRNINDQKSFLKNSEKMLKQRRISLENYGKPQVQTGGIIFYPFLLEGKYPVRDAQERSPRGMRIRYDQKNHTLSIVNFDMGQYAYAEAPILTKTQILRNFRLGETLLSRPELVYLIQIASEETTNTQTIQFLPALKFTVAGQTEPFFQSLLQ
ncbi:hypothetical protein J5893_05580 [bacterium]|nr:hypothetical protein [bacterium]